MTAPSEDASSLLTDYVPITYGSKIAIFSAEHHAYICVESINTLSANRKKAGEWEFVVIEKAPKPTDKNKITSTREEREADFGDPVRYGDRVHLRGHRGKYFSVQSMGTINCTKDVPKSNETFTIALGEDLQDPNVDMSLLPVMNCSFVSFQSFSYNKYLVATKLGLVFCNRNEKNSWERFQVQMSYRHPLKEHLTRKMKTIKPAEDDLDLLALSVAPSRVPTTSTQKQKLFRDEESDEEDQVQVPLRRSEDFTIHNLEECGRFIEKFARKIAELKKMIKKMISMTDRDRLLDLIRNEIIATESIDKSLQQFFGKMAKKFDQDIHLERLHKQYLLVRSEFNTEVIENRDLKKAQAEKSSKKSARQQKSQKQVVRNDDNEIDAQLQTQLQQPKMKLKQADRYTMEVERAVALETYERVKNMETEYNDLHVLMQDVNSLLKEQDPLIEHVNRNVEDANTMINKGRGHLRDADKMRRPF
jgi:hypothetical protein